MDDASTDDTATIAESYGDRVRYHRQEHTRGIYGNANDGIALARGEYVAVYHGDDVYLPEIVEREVAFLEAHPEAGAVFASDVFVDADGRELGRLSLPPELRGGGPFDYRAILTGLLRHHNVFLRCPTALVRASVHREVGVYRDEEFLNTSDVDMWLRIARRYSIGILEDHLLRYRRGHGSSSERYHRLRTDQSRFFTIIDRYLAEDGVDGLPADALAAYRAHRAEDTLMRAASCYILGLPRDGLALLRRTEAAAIIGSRRVQRWRLLVLFVALHVLLRLPRIPPLADRFSRRWHSGAPKLSGGATH